MPMSPIMEPRARPCAFQKGRLPESFRAGPRYGRNVRLWRICALRSAQLTVSTVATEKRRDAGCKGAGLSPRRRPRIVVGSPARFMPPAPDAQPS